MNAPARLADAVARFGAPVPRYTSYPTAPHFHDGIDGGCYRRWLAELPAATPVSVYVHIPFCDRLCWFCGCHTKQTRRYEPVRRYLAALQSEIGLVGAAAGGRLTLGELHLGGGSPSMIEPGDLAALGETLRRHFELTAQARISVEIDPSDIGEGSIDGLKALGMNRASIGVQDFDPRVQRAINRIQTFADTAAVAQRLRAAGITSLNIDALYGLPFQTRATLERTIEQVVSLEPDRIALFGYAHVPWLKPHQRMIDDAALPDLAERFAQARLAEALLVQAGYVAIGIDHFARPGDSLARAAAEGRLRRNFQGYTDDPCETLIGLGASAIGRLPSGHAQNITATGNYMAAVSRDELPIARGIAFSADDRVRGHVIERLMCEFGFSGDELAARHGAAARPVIAEARARAEADRDGYFVREGDRFVITGAGRPFTRTIASWFDAYLGRGQARHSAGV
ncbi:MAG: coproporphyrinogen-III oxidase [Alphaproteobacteria bacterium]|nr:MAG: coproporphyrinogen-III oxidase [Alphaproteobacteria bacterium]